MMISKKVLSPVSRTRELTLDLVRGLSALLVMLGHLRGFVFEDYGDLGGVGPLTKIFYFATGLGHQAVMVFFVLSGYFVGGSVISGLINDRFSWVTYATARVTRLWMVLLPALLLTFCIDLLGAHWNPNGYGGAWRERFMSGPSQLEPVAHGGMTFLGNLGFLQDVLVPVYGTNGPLWSLANEFWYYVLFPLIAVAGFRPLSKDRMKPRVIRFFHLGLFALIVYFLPFGMMLSGSIWLMGVAVWLIRWQAMEGSDRLNSPVSKNWAKQFIEGWPFRILGGLFFLATLALSKTPHWLGGDYAVGSSFSVWTLSLFGMRPASRFLRRLATGLSDVSYTLYVVHFPLLFFFSVVLLEGRQFPADREGFLWFGGMASAVLLISTGMWWLFERNTDSLRKWIDRKLGRKSS